MALLIPGAILVLSGALVILKKPWPGTVLLLSGFLFFGAWQWDRTHETIVKRPVILMKGRLIKQDAKNPAQSLYEIEVADTDIPYGVKGRATAGDINGAGPGNQVYVEIAQRPLTGPYVKTLKRGKY